MSYEANRNSEFSHGSYDSGFIKVNLPLLQDPLSNTYKTKGEHSSWGKREVYAKDKGKVVFPTDYRLELIQRIGEYALQFKDMPQTNVRPYTDLPKSFDDLGCGCYAELSYPGTVCDYFESLTISTPVAKFEFNYRFYTNDEDGHERWKRPTKLRKLSPANRDFVTSVRKLKYELLKAVGDNARSYAKGENKDSDSESDSESEGEEKKSEYEERESENNGGKAEVEEGKGEKEATSSDKDEDDYYARVDEDDNYDFEEAARKTKKRRTVF